MKLPPPPEADSLREAGQAPAAWADFLRRVREGVPMWVRDTVAHAAAEFGSSAQRLAVNSDRQHTATVLSLLQGRREALVVALSQAIGRELDAAPRASAAAAAAEPTAERPDGNGPLKLTLLDEAQIDEDIEIARIVQAIESACENELRQVTALVCGLRGLVGVEPGAAPLPPLACAIGLRTGLMAVSADAGARLLLLRQLGASLGLELREVYRALADSLTRQGVEPARYRVRQLPAARAAGAAGDSRAAGDPARHPGAAAERPAVLGAVGAVGAMGAMSVVGATGATGAEGAQSALASAALWRLVERARAALLADEALPERRSGGRRAATAPIADRDSAHGNSAERDGAGGSDPEGWGQTLRLLADPMPGEQVHRALDPATAARLMERLLQQIEQHVGHSPGTRAVLAELREPGRALAEAEPRLWSSQEHPWWQFLDRLIAVGTVHGDADEREPGLVTQSLSLVVKRMRQSEVLDREACQQAADGVERVAARCLEERRKTLDAQVGEIQSQVDAQDVEDDLRNHIVQQLRSTPASPGLRQFLVGVWTQAMTQVTLRHGLNSAQMDAMAFAVDDLIRASAKPGRPVSAPLRSVLLRQVADGLAQGSVPAARAEAELADLQALLADPPPVQAERWDEPTDTLPVPAVLDLQAGLPTVPVVPMGTGYDSMLDATNHQSWLESLKAGDYCRLFLLGRWMTARLTWVGGSRNLFLFSSRHGGRTHSLTARMLAKLRNAGLATTIEDGFLLAQAIDTLAESDFGAG